MKKYTIYINRHLISTATVEIEADDGMAAFEKAEKSDKFGFPFYYEATKYEYNLKFEDDEVAK